MPSLSAQVASSLSALDLTAVNFELIVQLVRAFVADQPGGLWGTLPTGAPSAASSKLRETAETVGEVEVLASARMLRPADETTSSSYGEGVGGGREKEGGLEGGGEGEGAEGVVLIFLPGLAEIEQVQQALVGAMCASGSRVQREWVLPLHAGLSSVERQRVFAPAPAGVTKVRR